MEYLAIMISLITLTICIAVYTKVAALEARIKATQVTYDQFAKIKELPPHPVQDEVLQFIREGKKVAAIKKAREVLGLSLVEAKQYVDDLTLKA